LRADHAGRALERVDDALGVARFAFDQRLARLVAAVRVALTEAAQDLQVQLAVAHQLLQAGFHLQDVAFAPAAGAGWWMSSLSVMVVTATIADPVPWHR
jgi:hypothetical protein